MLNSIFYQKIITSIFAHKRSMLAVLSLLFCELAVANNINVATQRLTTKEGLPEMTIFSLAKDRRGFMWFGTPNSLLRYDSQQFRVFNQNNVGDSTLAVSGAGNIFIDSKDRLWIGSWGEGLALYDRHMRLLDHFIYEANKPDSLANNKIQVIYEDSRGDIWIGTNGGGLSLYQPLNHSFINFVHDPQQANTISNDRVWSITEADPGILWIATSKGLNRLDTNVIDRSQAQFVRYEPDESLPQGLKHPLVRSVYADSKGRLWVGTQVDFGLFDGVTGDFEPVSLNPGLEVTIVNRIREDHDGNILIATLHGLYHYLPERQQVTPWAGEDKYPLFPQNDIRDVLVDHNGIIWITTRFAGVIKIDLKPSSIQTIRTLVVGDQAIEIDKVSAMIVDNENTLWLSTQAGLFYRPMDSEQFERFDLPVALDHRNITSIAKTDAHQLWLATHSGLFSIHTNTKTLTNRNDLLKPLATKSIQKLLVDSQNNLWVGTAHEGLVKVDHQGQLTYYSHDAKKPKSLSDNTILSLYEDNIGQIWVGTASAGVNRLDLNHQRFYQYQHDPSTANSIADNMINDITQTKDGTLWFSTPKSLDKLDFVSGNFIHYNATSGLTDPNVKTAREDEFGDLWVSSSGGIYRLDHQSQTFYHLNDHEQLGENNFLPNVGVRTTMGHVIFGGTNGFSEITPVKNQRQRSSSETMITSVMVDDLRLARYDFPADLPIELEYGTKSIKFYFAVLDFERPLEQRYRFKLEGFEDQWHTSQASFTNYTNLEPGRYQFKVSGSNSDNLWSENPSELTIIIKLPWWQFWWVRILFGLLTIGVIYLWLVYRMSSMSAKKNQLEQQVQLRTQELDRSNQALASTIERLNDSHNELLEQRKMASLGQMVAGIAHEVNTPLGVGITASTLLGQRMIEMKNAFSVKSLTPDQFSQFLDEGLQSTSIIFRNLERVASLIDGFKQVAVEQSSEQDCQFNVKQLLDDTLLAVSPHFQDLSHSIVVNCPAEIEIYSKPAPLTQVITNLVMNSLAHAFDDIVKGSIHIDVTVDQAQLVLIYRDDGIGVDAQLQKVIFDPFVTTKRGAGYIGLGMHLVYNIVTQALGGTIKLTSEVNQGIELKLIIPVDVRQSRLQ